MGKKRKKDKKDKAQLSLVESPPFVTGSPTSEAAAEEIKPSAGNLRERVYESIAQHSPHGITDEEIANCAMLNPSTARPRRVELQRAGRVIQVGEGKTAAGRRAALWATA